MEAMAVEPTIILSNGGLRSLVAVAVIQSEADQSCPMLLHMSIRQSTATVVLNHIRQQAKHFSIQQVIQIDLPQWPSVSPTSPLIRSQLLLTGLSYAATTTAKRLVWPAQVDADFDTVATLTEQAMLTQHLAQLDQFPADTEALMPTIETPLLEMTDRQLVELGGQLNVPWHLAWTCQNREENPCRLCHACRRRHQAFEAAGMIDPINETASAR